MTAMTAYPDFSTARRIRAGIDAAMEDSRAGNVADVLRAAPDDPRGAVYVVRLLECVPGIGKVVARRIAAEQGHDGMTRVSDLSVAEREDLVRILDGPA